MVVPLFVGRDRSIKALEVAMAADKQILLASQKNATEDQPNEKTIYRKLEHLATVLQLLKLPDGTVKLLVEGIKRGNIIKFIENQEYFLADVELIEDGSIDDKRS